MLIIRLQHWNGAHALDSLFGALRYCWHYPKPDESLLFSTSDSRSPLLPGDHERTFYCIS